MLIEIDNVKYTCKAESSTTQAGKPVTRIISDDAPVATNGFKLYLDDGGMEFDRSDYTYLYREEGNVKEYTQEPEQIIPTESFKTGTPESAIDRRFDAVNARITEVTPYTDSKKAYYGEVEKVFYGVPNGNLSVFFDGEYTVERVEDRVYVKFARLTETKDITVMVQ